MRVADLRAHLLDKLQLKVLEIIVPCRAARLVEERADHVSAAGRALDLRVELERIEALFIIRHGGVGAGLRMCDGDKARGQLVYLIRVAHEAKLLLIQPREEEGRGVHAHFSLAVLAGGAGRDLAAERPRHELRAVAYAEHGDAQLKYLLVAVRRGGVIHAVGSAGEDDADGRDGAYLLRAYVAGAHDGVHRALAHAPGDQLLILPAEIQNQNGL